MATFRQIRESLRINEGKLVKSKKEAKPGDWGETATKGNFVGMKQGEKGENNPTQGYKDPIKAKAYAAGHDPDKEDDIDQDEEEPKPEKEPTPEKEPKKSSSETNVDQPERIIAGKDKALKERDTRTVDSEPFTAPIKNPDDEQFKKDSTNYKSKGKGKGRDIRNPPPPFGFSQESSFMKNNKFPKKYLTVLERAMNCKIAKAGGFEPPWDFFSKEPGGAGRIGAQMGELMTTVGSAMSDEEWGDFKTQMRSHMKQTGRNKKEDSDQIIDESWLDSADKTRKRAHDRLKKKFPNAKIPDDIVASGWDTKDDVEEIKETIKKIDERLYEMTR